jgi:small-conductance mechanosensitive channel
MCDEYDESMKLDEDRIFWDIVFGSLYVIMILVVAWLVEDKQQLVSWLSWLSAIVFSVCLVVRIFRRLWGG